MNIASLISGGVDSSVALYLLKEQGYEPTAYYIKVWMEDDFGECPWQEDVDFVFAVCKLLGVKVEIVPLQREYWDRVIAYTLREIKAGRTPNPDMMCNRLVKFGAFYEKFHGEFDRIATGHYARTVVDERGRTHLMLCKDRKKDQTYFLSQMTYDQVTRAMFPLAEMTKSEVRALAKKLNFPNAKRPDSQGICFLGKINFRDFLKKYVGEQPGKIIEKETGKILGEHKGYWFYTIGQRTGLGLGGGPWFVVDKDTSENIIYVSHGYDPEALYKDHIQLADFNWINELPTDRQPEIAEEKDKIIHAEIQFKIRHTPELSDGLLQGPASTPVIIPAKPVAGVAKGQFGVIYQNEECFGGGVIC